MAEQIINNGASPGDPTAESIYAAFEKAKDNFSELYTAITTFLLKAGGTMTGVLQFANGTVGAPSAKIGADQKGFYHVDIDKLGVSVNGTKVGEFNSNGYMGLANRLVLQDRKTVNTSGGASSVGDNDRDLNTVILNNITGSSLASNQFVLPVGRYYVQKIASTAFRSDKTRLRLYNVTSAATQADINSNTIVSNSARFPSVTNMQCYLEISGYYFDVVTSAKTFKIIHTFESSDADGLGSAANLTEPEVYTIVDIVKVG